MPCYLPRRRQCRWLLGVRPCLNIVPAFRNERRNARHPATDRHTTDRHSRSDAPCPPHTHAHPADPTTWPVGALVGLAVAHPLECQQLSSTSPIMMPEPLAKPACSSCPAGVPGTHSYARAIACGCQSARASLVSSSVTMHCDGSVAQSLCSTFLRSTRPLATHSLPAGH